METIKIGLCGLGTVGTGVVQILAEHKKRIIHKLGCEVVISKILVNDITKKRDAAIDLSLITDDPDELVKNKDVDVIVEVMGGIKNTKELLEEALRHKKHIVTANKDLMALHGWALMLLAREHGCDILFDASIAGGIPIVRTLVDGLASDHIEKVMGIVNGTTNYIMTKMYKEGAAFDDALKEAQALGFAEQDPTADVEGIDAARKMTLLANLAFKMEVHLDDVDVFGITTISKDDISAARQMGYIIKLIGTASMNKRKVEVAVEPTLLPKHHPLASVENEFNAVYVYGKAVGETMFYGPGAGSLPTATAVVSDLMEVVRNIRLKISGHMYQEPQFKRSIKTKEEMFSKYFIRLEVLDCTGVFQEIANVFTKYEVSFQKISQQPKNKSGLAEIVMITHTINKAQLEHSLTELKQIDVIHRIISSYRVEGEE